MSPPQRVGYLNADLHYLLQLKRAYLIFDQSSPSIFHRDKGGPQYSFTSWMTQTLGD
jgi:hypothetical protein